MPTKSTAAVVVQSANTGPSVLYPSGLLVPLGTGEVSNALWAFNFDIPGPDGLPMYDRFEDGSQRPRAIWFTDTHMARIKAASTKLFG